MRTFGFCWAALAACALFTAAARGTEPTEDSLDRIEQNLTEQKAILVDVREDRETNEGYIAGAVLVPLSLLDEGQEAEGFADILAQMLPRDKILYVYCRTGNRSLEAAGIFARFRYDARSLKQGFEDLAEEGFVVARPKAASED